MLTQRKESGMDIYSLSLTISPCSWGQPWFSFRKSAPPILVQWFGWRWLPSPVLTISCPLGHRMDTCQSPFKVSAQTFTRQPKRDTPFC